MAPTIRANRQRKGLDGLALTIDRAFCVLSMAVNRENLEISHLLVDFKSKISEVNVYAKQSNNATIAKHAISRSLTVFTNNLTREHQIAEGKGKDPRNLFWRLSLPLGHNSKELYFASGNMSPKSFASETGSE
jgi:hypothetical protein